MKRILHIVGGMNVGGTETMLMNLFRKVNKEIKFDFISYYDYDGYYDEEIRQLGGKVIRLKSPKKIGMLKSINELKEAIKENGPYQAVHSHTLFNCGVSNLAAMISRVNIRVAHSHTTNDNNKGIIRWSYEKLMQLMIKAFSTDFLACSESAGVYLFGDKITKNKKYRIIPNYIDYKKFLNCSDNMSIKEELNIKKNETVICHIGRFINSKNHIFLVEIMNCLIKKDNSIKLILVGDGNEKKIIEKKIIDLGLEKNIYFLGLRNDIDIILNNSDLFIFPSIYEGLGLVMLEAQSCGLPCIVSEAIQPEANLDIGLVKQLNLSDGVERWSEEIYRLIGKKNKNKRDIEKAFIDKGYSLENIVTTLEDVYKLSKEIY